MKKLFGILIALILAVVTVFGVAGCNKKPAEKSPEEEESMGTFYTLQEAYDKGYLTKTDIKDICYYRFGEVWEGEDLKSENWIKVEYTPTQSLTDLDKKIEMAIKVTYYTLNEDLFYNQNVGKIGDINDLTVRFFGEFSNSYVVIVDCSLWDSGAVSTPMLVAGIAWWESGDGFKVFRAE